MANPTLPTPPFVNFPTQDTVPQFWWNRGYDPRKCLALYYDETINMFFEVEEYEAGFLEPIHNIYQILEPWKVMLFKENGDCVFPDRTNSFLVELNWLPF